MWVRKKLELEGGGGSKKERESGRDRKEQREMMTRHDWRMMTRANTIEQNKKAQKI